MSKAHQYDADGALLPRGKRRVPLLEAVTEQKDALRLKFDEKSHVVESTGCLIWTGAKNQDGRGRITVKIDGIRVQCLVPRVQYVIEHGVDPGSQLVLHGPCDRPECFAIDHLRLGGYSDNVRDMLERGRARIGTDHPFSKLRDVDVRFIADRLDTHTDMEIAAALGFIVCRRTIRCIRDGHTWRHITGIKPRPRKLAA